MRSTSPRLPRALAPGASIALVAPAGPLRDDRIELSLARCRALGLDPVLFPSARSREGYLAGSDEERLSDLQAAFDDPKIDGIWALRGGYGTLRILDGLDLSRQERDPIPFLGFSDNTTIHQRHVGVGTISFHGPHPGAEFPTETETSLRNVLFSDAPPGLLPVSPTDPRPRTLRGGKIEARLIGGNLALLASLSGSKEALSTRGRILFLEDVGEPPYRIDRMLMQLERAGAFDGIAGLALGRFCSPSADDDSILSTLLETTADRLGVPAVIDLPFGHVEHNCTLPVGGLALLDADSATLALTEGVVRPT